MLDLEPRFGLKQTDDSSPRGSEKKRRIVHPPFLANYPDPLSWLFITNLCNESILSPHPVYSPHLNPFCWQNLSKNLVIHTLSHVRIQNKYWKNCEGLHYESRNVQYNGSTVNNSWYSWVMENYGISEGNKTENFQADEIYI